MTLTCADSDLALRELLGRFPAAHDIEVYGAGIEEAFVALTADTMTRPLTTAATGGLIMATTYLRSEVLRSFRNRRFLVLSLAFPLVLYLVIAGANRHQHFDGATFPLYFMTGMATLGTMSAVISGGAVIAAERSVGWTRQMRLTPLTTRSYFGAKVASGYLRACSSSWCCAWPARRSACGSRPVNG